MTLILPPLSGIVARRGTPQESAPHPASQEHLHGTFVVLRGSDKETALYANGKKAHINMRYLLVCAFAFGKRHKPTAKDSRQSKLSA